MQGAIGFDARRQNFAHNISSGQRYGLLRCGLTDSPHIG